MSLWTQRDSSRGRVNRGEVDQAVSPMPTRSTRKGKTGNTGPGCLVANYRRRPYATELYFVDTV